MGLFARLQTFAGHFASFQTVFKRPGTRRRKGWICVLDWTYTGPLGNHLSIPSNHCTTPYIYSHVKPITPQTWFFQHFPYRWCFSSVRLPRIRHRAIERSSALLHVSFIGRSGGTEKASKLVAWSVPRSHQLGAFTPLRRAPLHV